MKKLLDNFIKLAQLLVIFFLAMQSACTFTRRDAVEKLWSSTRSSESATDGYLLCVLIKGDFVVLTGAATFDKFPFEWTAKLNRSGNNLVGNLSDEYGNRYNIILHDVGSAKKIKIHLLAFGDLPDAREAATLDGSYDLTEGQNSACW